MSTIDIRAIDPISAGDAATVTQILKDSWGSTVVISRGVAHDAVRLPGFIAECAGAPAGPVTYCPDGSASEVVTLDSLQRECGVGTALLSGVSAAARAAGGTRLWLITTNNNFDALRFYQRRGWRLRGVHRGAVDEARRRKPIPLVGAYGIEIHDDLELDLTISDDRRGSPGA